MFAKFRKFFRVFINYFSEKKEINTYIFFFFISFSFWFLTMLSKTHESTFLIPIEYINYPADLIEVVPPSDFVQIRVKAAGISMVLFYLFNDHKLILNYNVANSQPIVNGKNLFWIMNSKRKEIAGILGSSIEIMNINPERIIVPFVNKIKRVFPVVLDSDINLKQAFWFAKDIKIDPSSITLYGEQNLLDSITSIKTELLKLDNIDQDQTHNVALVIPKGLDCKVNSVSVDLRVKPFVEEIVTKKVEIRNLNKGYSMKLFPKYVNVTIRLPKDKYSILKTNFLRLYIDASDVGDEKTILVTYDNLPTEVRIERIYPNRLEFLLIKE